MPVQLQPPYSSKPTRRSFLLATGLAVLGVVGCGRLTGDGGGGGGDTLTFLSTQFTPVEEAERFRKILADVYKDKQVDYVTTEVAAFTDRVRSAAQSENVNFHLLGALHGQFAPLIEQLDDVSDVMDSLSDRGFTSDLLDLTKLGTDRSLYVPWAQATYILAAHESAMDALPSGADANALSYDQLLEWATALREKTGRPAFGLPAGPKGLLHRFFQGFAYPSFTGTAITKFASPEAQEMWRYLQRLWEVTLPASANFEFMQEPLAAGQVLLAWDHVARLIDAPRRKPGEFRMLPVPAGPAGRGYMPVVAGLAIPKGAPDREATVDLITALSTPEAQIEVLRQNAFFPAIEAELPSDLPPGVAEQAKAVELQQNAEDRILALPPAGLGEKEGEFTQVYKDCFTEIVLRKGNPATVLPKQAETMQRLIDDTGAECWAPDPPSNGEACTVGR